MSTTQPTTSGRTRQTEDAINAFDAVARRLDGRFVGRERAVRLLQLAVICREHVLLLGPPGTAKTDLVTRFAELLRATRFSYLLTRFTEPSEIFGPLDFDAFRDRVYRIHTNGMLPEAEIAFLDEIFQGGSAILNSLLSLINERVFHNGGAPVRTPLVSLVGASNELPDDPVLRAFADRFLLRVELGPVAGTNLHDLLDLGWEREKQALRSPSAPGGSAPVPMEQPIVALTDVAALSTQVADVDMTEVMDVYQEIIRNLIAERVTLSDRRVVRGLKLVAGAAVLRNATRAAPRDLWPLTHFWTDQADAPRFVEIVQPRVVADGGEQLRTGRTAGQISADVSWEFDQATRRAADGSMAPTAITRALGRMNELYHELLRDHPHATGEVNDVNQKMDTLLHDLHRHP